MIFHEIYGAYYNAVAKILTAAVSGKLSNNEMQSLIEQSAFGESFITILPALQEQRWQLLTPDGGTNLRHAPTLPLTTLQKRWLKSILLDRRIKLFYQGELPELEGTEPLFTDDDHYEYDRFLDGDNYDDPKYIKNFSTILQAMKEGRSLTLHIVTKNGSKLTYQAIPYKLEYSGKDDKFRLDHIKNGKRNYVNLAHIESLELGDKAPLPEPVPERKYRYFTMELTDERNALERAMVGFGQYKKEVVKEKNGKYTVKIYYDVQDETELLINVLSFGPMVYVKAPARFQNLLKNRLMKQAKLWKM